MRRTRLLAGLAVLLVPAALLWFLARPEERARGIQARSGSEAAPARGGAIELERADASATERRALAGSDVAGQTAAPAPTEPGAPVLRVNGLALESSRQVPVPHAQVFLSGRSARAATETGADGRFQLALPESDWRFGEHCELALERDGAPIFSGTVALEPELVVQAWNRLTLRGRLVTNIDLEREMFFLGISLPLAEAGDLALYASDTRLAPDGSFEVETWVDDVPASFLLVFSGLRGRFYARPVPAAELIAEEGATIEQRFGELVLVCVDETKTPVPDAQVRLFASGGGNDPEAWSSVTSHADGVARFFVLRGSVELCAGKTGFASVTATLEHDGASTLEHEVLLRRLGESDRVRGRVLDPRGTPVAGAYVSALPVTGHPELSVVGASSAQTDERGVFALEAGRDRALAVTAYRADLGASAPVLAQPGESELTLLFGAQPPPR